MCRVVTSIILFSSLLLADIAIVKKVTGIVEVKRGKQIIIVTQGMSLKDKDIILTKAKSSVGIIFDDGSRLSLGEKAIFVINKFHVQPSKKSYDVDLKLEKGKAIFSSGKIGKLAPESVKFRIPEGIIGIRGTKFAVEVK
jgi:hypothetical protein